MSTRMGCDHLKEFLNQLNLLIFAYIYICNISKVICILKFVYCFMILFLTVYILNIFYYYYHVVIK
jgi:hypothetical protein